MAREGVKPWSGVISPHEMTEDLQTAFVAPSDDDYDGVDVTRAGDYQISVPEQPEFGNIILNDPAIEPPRLIFCDSSSVGYNAIISEIAPQSDGTCQVTAKEYRDAFYQYDNAFYPGNVA